MVDNYTGVKEKYDFHSSQQSLSALTLEHLFDRLLVLGSWKWAETSILARVRLNFSHAIDTLPFSNIPKKSQTLGREYAAFPVA